LNQRSLESKVFRNDAVLKELFSRKEPWLVWSAVLQKFAEAVERYPDRLRAEAWVYQVLGDRDEVGLLLSELASLDPISGIQLLHYQSPELDLDTVSKQDPFEVALAALRIFAPLEP